MHSSEHDNCTVYDSKNDIITHVGYNTCTTQQDHSCIAEYVNYLEEILQTMSGIVRVGIRTNRYNFGYNGVHRVL